MAKRKKIRVNIVVTEDPDEREAARIPVECLGSGGCAGSRSGGSIGSKCKRRMVYSGEHGDADVEVHLISPLEEGEESDLDLDDEE